MLVFHSKNRGVKLNQPKTQSASQDYFDARRLKKGAAGWVLLAGLGVSYVISGDFAGWNLGLAQGGFGGMFIAFILAAIMYLSISLSIAELSSALPVTGGGYSFARRALGPWGGYLTGMAILLEYTLAPAAIAIFIGGYVHSLIGIDGWIVYLISYVIFVGIHLWGVGEALTTMFVITLIASLAIIMFSLNMFTHFNWNNLFDIASNESALGASAFFPKGYIGIWAAFPFAMWFFLAIEGVPLAAEEARDPAKDIPKGIITAMGILFIFGLLVLVLSLGGAGADFMKDHNAPLVGALQKVHGQDSQLAVFVNWIGISGLLASFFSIIYAYSRQIFALSRSGYLPRFLSVTSKRKVPTRALIIPGVIGFLLSLTGQGDLMLTMAVFGATISYILMMISHIVLRKTEPNLKRPYRTFGGTITSGIALTLSIVAFISTSISNLNAVIWSMIFYLISIAYFFFYSRHHLVTNAPEEEVK